VESRGILVQHVRMKSVVLGCVAYTGVLFLVASPSPPAIAARVDHLILGIRDLDEGVRQFERRTGVRPAIGGEHPGRGTRNALASLGDGHYLEILAPQDGAPDSERVRALRTLADLSPVGWAVSVRDMDAARSRLIAAGFALSDVMPGSRARPDGSLLEWRTFEIAKPPIAGAPFFIRWGDRTTHPSLDSPAGCRLERLRVVTPAADDLRRVLAALPLDVAVEKGGSGALDITLRCPKGTVTLSGAAASSAPR
jgi:glyoxalase-like protein